MKSMIFVTADSVEVYGGKLVIVGVFDSVRCTSFPVTIRPFGLAIKLVADKRDYGKERSAKVIMRKSRTSKAIYEVFIKTKFKKPTGKKLPTAVISISSGPQTLQEPGKYLFELKVGDEVIGDTAIYLEDVRNRRNSRAKKG